MWVSRSISGLLRCSRSPRPVSVARYTVCPSAVRNSPVRFHSQPPAVAPWTITKVYLSSAACTAVDSRARKARTGARRRIGSRVMVARWAACGCTGRRRGCHVRRGEWAAIPHSPAAMPGRNGWPAPGMACAPRLQHRGGAFWHDFRHAPAPARGAGMAALDPGIPACAPPAATCSSSAPVERAKKPLDILILGGTGFTGPFQVQYALARGHRVTLFNRGRRPSPEWPDEVEQLSGDRNTGDLAALRGRRWDVCIDNPTTLPFWVRDAGQVLKDSVGQYIFIST